MFGILNKKGGSVFQTTVSAITASSQKKKKRWIVTPRFGPKYTPKMQAPIKRLCVVSFEKPLFKEHALLHDGRIYRKERSIESNLKDQSNLPMVFSKILQTIDGEYALTLCDGKEILVARDLLGRRPIFYDENSEIIAFCSEKKSLWKIGLQNVKPLRAGQVLHISDKGIHIYETTSLKKGVVSAGRDDLDNILEIYGKLLNTAIRKRLGKTRKIGALLSGGVDSTLLAKSLLEITGKESSKLTIYTAGTPDASDMVYAERFAREYGLNHKVRKLELSDVESYIPKVIRTVEERDFVQIEAGVGVYAAVEMAAQDGAEVIFSGQGPDELWGGYEWYPEVIAREGFEGFLARSWGDLERADIETLDRENKIATAHGITTVFPYIDTEIVKLAMSVSPKLKINSTLDKLGKRPHRELAIKLGLPSEFAAREKEAAQHGTGIHALLDKIAQKNGYNPNMIQRIKYSSKKISKEKLSSSARYGYLYADKNAWQIDEHIQFLFDAIAYKDGLLNEPERRKIKTYIKKM